ncbi:MAG: 3-keto-5-aminohexanoate cleavage protein [Chitinophagales bacterium]
MQKLIINFTPTGMIPTKSLTSHVPISPSEIIEQVHEVYEIGITLVHLHARSEDGKPTYKINIYREIVEGIRKYCPDLVLGVSLSGRSNPEFEKRSQVLELQPDMGSLTLSSLNFSTQASMNSPEMIQKLALKMNELGVHPELECFDSGMIHYSKYLIRKGILRPPFYFNLLVGNIFNAQLDLATIGLMVRDLPSNSHWSLAGLGNHQLAANSIAIAAGGGVRVGLEDNIWLDQKRTILATNLELIQRIHSLAAIAERPIMGAKEFGELGFYNSK